MIDQSINKPINQTTKHQTYNFCWSVGLSVGSRFVLFQLMKHLAHPNEILSYGKVMEAPGNVMEASGKSFFEWTYLKFSA